MQKHPDTKNGYIVTSLTRQTPVLILILTISASKPCGRAFSIDTASAKPRGGFDRKPILILSDEPHLHADSAFCNHACAQLVEIVHSPSLVGNSPVRESGLIGIKDNRNGKNMNISYCFYTHIRVI